MSEIRDRRGQISYDTDVLVVGGGAAGVAAAFTAARTGARVLLLEKYGFCGGAAVAGLSGTVRGLYAAPQGAAKPPEQEGFGFATRFFWVMENKEGIRDPPPYGKTHTPP